MQKTNFRFNVIVADDCSTDGNLEIIKRCAAESDLEFIYMDSEKNLGLRLNSSKSFLFCNAEYIAFMEGDDFWTDPYRLQKHVDFLDNHRECTMSFNRRLDAYQDKGIMLAHTTVPDDGFEYVPTGTIILQGGPNNSTCVYRKTTLDRIAAEYEYFWHNYRSDWTMQIMASTLGLVGLLKGIMSVYRIHKTGIWSGADVFERTKRHLRGIAVMDEITGMKFSAAFDERRRYCYTELDSIVAARENELPKLRQDVLSGEDHSKRLSLRQNPRNVWVSELNPLITSAENEIIIYADGDIVAAAGLMTQLMRDYGDVKIVYVVSEDAVTQGELLFGVPVVAPEHLIRYTSKACVIVMPGANSLAITSKLNRFGYYDVCYYNEWASVMSGVLDRRNAFIINNREMLDKLLEENDRGISMVRLFLQHDEKSLNVFNAKLDSSFFGRHLPLEDVCEGNQYFVSDIIEFSDKEVFVDCGSYDGAATMEFIQKSGGGHEYVYAFEPCPIQYEYAKIRMEHHKIMRYDLHNLGVYDKVGEVSFDMLGAGSGKISEGGKTTISVTSLDALLYDKEHRPTFIKMDIEGAEMEALEGAKKIIERDRPKLAISAYHGLPNTHLWEIPLWIKSNFPDYTIYFRQHAALNETVCYAVPYKVKPQVPKDSEVRILQEQLNFAQDQVNRFETSTCWKITKPLRVVMNAIRAITGGTRE